MARIKPFKGIRYNPNRISDMGKVVCPPYDVISKHEQAALYDRDTHNMIRMELGKRRSGDDSAENPHSRAGRYFRAWLDEGVLMQENEPAMYLVATEFEISEGLRTRWGLLVSVELEPFHRGGILPHEHTYSKIKSERLSLMRACHANLSPIFSFFSDERSTMPQLKSRLASTTPAFDFRDENRHHHRLWVIKDPELHRVVRSNLADQPLFIADGHHRYETALAYRDELSAVHGGLPEDHPAKCTLMYLSSIQDPGLKILPAHRLLPQVAPHIRRRFLDRIRPFFNVQPIEANGKLAETTKRLLTRLDETLPGEGLVVVIRDMDTPVLLLLKPERKGELYTTDTPEMMRGIDVTLLSDFVFPKVLGLSRSHLDDVNCVHYHQDAQTALEGVYAGQYDMAFIIKPTPLAAVQRIADAGQVMPRKSTYFAPKVITGLVMHALQQPL
jgi:uncharacterized protein (DUF1015 family)